MSGDNFITQTSQFKNLLQWFYLKMLIVGILYICILARIP